jgi:ubiquinone/menaquinone biosynthesis C-methylase UbiE
VLAQEIDAAKLKTVAQVAGTQGLHQITPVLGQSDDPRLPDGLANLIYMNRVLHHFAKPQPMLQRLWQDLKPGGLLELRSVSLAPSAKTRMS